MKYILIIGDGMADNPVESLGGKTPLEAANIPTIDRLAAAGLLGSAKTARLRSHPAAILPSCPFSAATPINIIPAAHLSRLLLRALA